jgi:hypothetical protein
MPADDFDFEIPELNRIGSLMRDLMPEPGVKSSRPRSPRKTNGAAPNRMAAATVSRFAESVNWRNAEGVKSPFAGSPTTAARPLGGLSVATFAAGVNWTNGTDGSRLVTVTATAVPGGPPETLETFLDSFAWE